MLDYPSYVCSDCAESAGGKFPVGHVACFHTGICPCCGCIKTLTEPRDYGYPNLKVSYEYRAIEAMARELGQSSLYRDKPAEDSTRESSEGPISEVRLDEKRDCVTTSPDIGDEDCHGDGSRNTSFIEVSGDKIVKADYESMIVYLETIDKNIPRVIIEKLQELAQQQRLENGY